MKLASYKDGTRDGHLVVVSRDLKTAHYATAAASAMQQLLDDWGFISPQLQDIYDALNQGRLRHAFPFEPARCEAPLPRAYLWVRHGRNETASQLSRGAADYLSGAHDEIVVPATAHEVSAAFVAAGVAAFTGDVPHRAKAGEALEGVRLLSLVGDISLDADLGHIGSQIATAFGPVAATPDELGPAWRGGRVHLGLTLSRAGEAPLEQRIDLAMPRHFGELIESLCATRRLSAGAIVGSMIIESRDREPLTLQRGAELRIATARDDAETGSPTASAFGEMRLRLAEGAGSRGEEAARS